MISALSLCSMKQGWEIKKLGEVCEIINGFAFKSQLFKDCGDDILRISNIQNGVIDDSEIAHFSKEDYPKINFEKYAVLPDDIVVALSGATTGKFGINNTGRKLYLNQRVAICREKTSKLHHLFLLYFLQTQSKSFLESAAGVAQPNLSTEQMKQYDIPIPPLPEQEKIVSELDCLSVLIEKKRQQLKELDALAQSIFYEMFGNPVENERGWEVKKIGEVSHIVNGFAFPSSAFAECNPVKVIKITNVGVNEFVHDDSSLPDKYNNKDDYKVHTEDIVIALTRTVISKGLKRAIVPSEYNNALVNQRVAAIITDNRVVEKSFVYLFLGTDFVKDYVLAHATALMQPNLSIKDLRELPIPLPPLPLQQTFAQKVEAIEKQKELIKQSIIEAETLLASRMQYYFEEG